MGCMGPMGLKGPIREFNGLYRAHRNDTDKSVSERSKIFSFYFIFFVFGDHMKIRRKLCYFPGLF